MATTRKLIGQIIRYYRVQQNMTQEELGNKIGKDRQYIWKIENGKINTTFDTLDLIIRGLGNKHEDFFNLKQISKSK